MDMQNVAKLEIPEGEVRTIHDKNGNLIWGKVSYSVKYEGNTAQNGTPTPDAPVAVQTVTGENTITISDGQGNEQSYEVNLGKNLFDKDNANVLNAYFALPSDTTITSNAQNRTLYVPCDANTTYTFQAMGSNWIRQVGYTATTPAVGVSVSGITNLERNATSITITTGSTAKYLVFRFWHKNNSTETYQQALDSIQLEKGSQATSYAAYFTPIELCKIGTYQDSIYKSGGKWYVHKAINKVTVDGSAGGLNSNNNWYFYSLLSLPTPVNSGDIISNYFTGSTRTYMQNNKTVDGLAAISTNTDIIFRNTTYSSAADYKTWLAANTPTFYYQLATPTDTEITNETLVGQLEAVEQWLTRYGYNATVSGNLPIIIDRTAL